MSIIKNAPWLLTQILRLILLIVLFPFKIKIMTDFYSNNGLWRAIAVFINDTFVPDDIFSQSWEEWKGWADIGLSLPLQYLEDIILFIGARFKTDTNEVFAYSTSNTSSGKLSQRSGRCRMYNFQLKGRKETSGYCKGSPLISLLKRRG